MGSSKRYNYEKAVKLILEKYNSEHKVITYNEMKEVLELEDYPDTSSCSSYNAVGSLKKILKQQHCITLISNCTNGKIMSPEEKYFNIVEYSKCEKKETSNVHKELAKDESFYKALEKDNQKLYLELE